jgi:hypothetical protein
VFLSQIDRLWNKILWQLSVHFCHPWRINKTDFTGQVITCILLKINKQNSVCERVLVDSTMLVVWPIDRSRSIKRKSALRLMDRTAYTSITWNIVRSI